jgi:hypothetical protein
MTCARDVWIDDEGFVCEYTIDAIMLGAAPGNEWPVAASTIDWSEIPDSPRAALQPFVSALADLLLADLVRNPRLSS